MIHNESVANYTELISIPIRSVTNASESVSTHCKVFVSLNMLDNFLCVGLPVSPGLYLALSVWMREMWDLALNIRFLDSSKLTAPVALTNNVKE